MPPLATLPSEILPKIFTFLTPGSLPAAVSREFALASACDLLWWELFFRQWPRRRLRDGRVPPGKYSVTPGGWRERFKRKISPAEDAVPDFVVFDVPRESAAISISSSCCSEVGESDKEEYDEEEEEEHPFLRRCYYEGYGRAMAEEGSKTKKCRLI